MLNHIDYKWLIKDKILYNGDYRILLYMQIAAPIKKIKKGKGL